MVFLSSRISPFNVNGDLFGEVAAGHRRGDVGDVADLAGQVAGHEIDAVGQVLPGARDPSHVGLAAQPAFGADLARHPGDLGGERAELIDHRVDGVLQLQNLAFDVNRDLFGEVAVGDRSGHLRDISHLRGQVARHRIDAISQVLPGSRHPLDSRLPAELALGAHLARHPRDLSRERAKLIHHRVDSVLQFEEFALNVNGDFFG